MSEELSPLEQLGDLRYENEKKERELMQKFALDNEAGFALKSPSSFIDYLKIKEIEINDESPFELVNEETVKKIPVDAKSKVDLFTQLRKTGLKEESPLFKCIYETHSESLKIR